MGSEHLVDDLESVQKYPVKFNLNQTRWEGWQAVLAKVCVLRSSTPSLTSSAAHLAFFRPHEEAPMGHYLWWK